MSTRRIKCACFEAVDVVGWMYERIGGTVKGVSGLDLGDCG